MGYMADEQTKAADAAHEDEVKAQAKIEADVVAENPPGEPDVAEDVTANEAIAAARPEVGTEIEVPFATEDAEAPPEPTVKVALSPTFQVPELEEYTDEQGRPRGRVAGYETPDEVRVSIASVSADDDFSDDNGAVVLSSTPIEVPARVGKELALSPAVEVVE